MRLGLLLVFAAIPFLEIALLIKVGQAVGFWPTLLLVVASAALGTYVIYAQGFQVLRRAAETMSRGRAPVAPVIDGLFILVAGLLLIVPGFITDAMGLALLVPYLRHRFAVWCLKQVLKSADIRAFFFGAGAPGAPGAAGTRSADKAQARPGAGTVPPGEGPIIDGEFERIDERTVDTDRGRTSRTGSDGRPAR